MKSFSLSKTAIFNNAKAVNSRFKISQSDRWLSSLSKFHIGGLSIFARAYLSGSEVISIERSWDPEVFIKDLKVENIQYASLVPTQLYDLVTKNLSCPSCVKAIFIGGDFASEELCQRAVALGWRLIITFGMTEVASQMASSYFEDIKSGYLELFDIHKLKAQGESHKITSSSLFTEKITFLQDRKIEVEHSDNFVLNDHIGLKSLVGSVYLKPLGRKDDAFKLKGRLYYLNTIKNDIASGLMRMGILDKVHLELRDDLRLGKRIMIFLLDELKNDQDAIIKMLAEKSSIPADLFTFEFVPIFEKTLLGKIKKMK